MNGLSSTAELDRLRSMEEFAALGQFLFCFGTDLLGLPHTFGREELESELFTVSSELIQRIAMGLLKMVSSHRGLIPDQFEEYTRRQYRTRKPAASPFGDDQEPIKFWTLDVFARVRILHQLSVWVFLHPDRIREKMKDADEKEQLSWRMEPCGYDRKGNTYYILDDNRLYRRTPWISEPQPAKKVKSSKRKGTKRRRVSAAVEAEAEEAEEEQAEGTWSCVCVSLQDWALFVNSLHRSNDPDEQAMHAYLKEDVVPVLQRVWLEKEKQRQLQEAVANRKRSSRLDAKLARQREEEEKAATAKREAETVAVLRRRQLEAEKKEKERELRMKIRQQRNKERELHENQASRSTSADDSSASGARRSSRRVKPEVEKVEKSPAEEEWVFDCVCGANGINYEDGTEIIGCDSCDVWQHLSCQKLPPGAENEDFICDLCQRYKKSQAGPVGPDGLPVNPQIIKLRVGPPSPEKARDPSNAMVNSSPKQFGMTDPTSMDVEAAEDLSPGVTEDVNGGIDLGAADR